MRFLIIVTHLSSLGVNLVILRFLVCKRAFGYRISSRVLSWSFLQFLGKSSKFLRKQEKKLTRELISVYTGHDNWSGG